MALTSAGGILALLDEPEPELHTFALTKLDEIVGDFWAEISDQVEKIEIIYEDEAYAERELAALVASKVYYHLGEFEDAVSYALSAGGKFDINSTSEYVLTILSKCIDQYTALRQAGEPVEDARLDAVVQRMFDRCFSGKQYRQAAGIALETRRIDMLERAVNDSGDAGSMLRYVFEVTMSLIVHRGFRNEVLRVLSTLYSKLAKPDYFGICQCLIFLDDGLAAAEVVINLLQMKNTALAYQIAFDLYGSSTQQFLAIVMARLESLKAPAGEGEGAAPAVDPKVLEQCESILSGTYTLEMYKEFLSRRNNTDKMILGNTKDALPQNSVCHSALVMSNCLMYAGTTQDEFLRDNRQWLARAANWAKFSVVASLGVIHKGHTAVAKEVLAPYLPKDGATPEGPYATGGAFYALGLIYANHGGDITAYLVDQLREPGITEVTQHGCCLGIGLAAMATRKKEIYEPLYMKLETDSAVAGEAAGIAMGLVMLGSADEEALNVMRNYARDTQHEKIIRGLAVGISLLMYGRQEEADVLIEDLCGDKDPILRMAGCHTIATAYAGANENRVIKRLLHIAVSDVSDDVRRSAVTSLGFVLCRSPEQLPSTVMLLCESFNPHVRYGSCMALGIACAGSGSPEAISLIEPLIQDPVGYVRQGALIALALIMIQQPNSHPKAKWTREQLTKIIGDKHQDLLAKFGAIYAQGILDCGGRNVTARMVNDGGHVRMNAVVGMLLFTQFWFWFPLGHCLSLAFTPTTLVCLNAELKMPNLKLKSAAPPSKFAYPPKLEPPKEKSKEKVETAVLSISSKGKKKSEEKKEGEDKMEVEEDAKKEDGEKDEAGADKKAETAAEPEPEPDFEMLANPARVVHDQLAVVSLAGEARYFPVRAGVMHGGIVVLTDKTPDEPEDLIEIAAPPQGEEPVGEAEMPEPFDFKAENEDEDE